MASEYGWSKGMILTEVYPDELPKLSDQIERRHVDDWLIQLRLYSNPYTKDPKAFVEDLMKARDRLLGISDRQPSFDELKSSVELLKGARGIKAKR